MSENYIEKVKNLLLEHNPKLQIYFDKTFIKKAPSTIKNDLLALKYFLNLIQCWTPSKITQKHIIAYNKDDKISPRSKAQYNIKIRALLKSYNKKNLAAGIKDAKIRHKELDKTTLIGRKDLKKILNICSVKQKALIMTNYEGALRRGELIGIKRENINFFSTHAEIYISTSKTTKRNIILKESLPFLKEYLAKVHFEPNERIFPYVDNSLPVIYNQIFKRTKKKYPKWKKQKLNPHLLRHSRLTELALTKLNEPQLRKFAGWSKNSDMPSVYFHIDDSDIRKIILENDYEQPKPIAETLEMINCEACNEPNGSENIMCWNCGHNLGTTDLRGFQKDFKELLEINKDLKKRIVKLEEITNKIPELLKVYETVYNPIKMAEDLLSKDKSIKEFLKK
ncbi:hypothetical protein ES702_05213 [subsurface metagenome]